MKSINEIEFIELLISNNHDEHFNYLVEINNSLDIELSNVTNSNKFINCKFQGKRMNFSNLLADVNDEIQHTFIFDHCEILNDVYFKNCSLAELNFINISKPIKNLHLAPKKLGYFKFECKEDLEQEISNEINITVHNCEILNYLDFLHLKSSGKLHIYSCVINRLKIHDSSFDRVDIEKSKFTSDFQFTLNNIKDSYFKYNEFEKSNFSLTDFGMDSEFRNNDFKGTALFERLKNESKTRLKFKSCNFIKYAYFNKSNLYNLRIDTSKFQETASFQELQLNSVFIDRTIFEKPVFFDDIEISNFRNCNKKTLRNIKQQLLRADNKIDYDKFRVHELNSYKNELQRQLANGKKGGRNKLHSDLWILRIGTFFSNNGTDWQKAVGRTLFVAILFYSVFYALHNFSREINLTNPSNYNEYFIGLFRYFLITDFHNPLVSEREYLEKAWEWIPFIVGKILIGIGLYEILVSFRKFKK